MQIITVSGIDGSGKSTQLKLLKNHLKDQSKTVVSFHAVSFSLINHFLKKKKESQNNKLKTKTDEHPEQSNLFEQPAQAVTSGNFLTIWARKIILLIDLIRFKFFRKKLEKNQTDYLLSDRYFYDQIINILYLSYKDNILREISNPSGHKIHIQLSPLLKLARKLIIPPSKSFFIDVSPDTALNRDRKIEQGKEYLVIKRVLYKKFLESWQIQLINGEQNKENVFQKIKAVII